MGGNEARDADRGDRGAGVLSTDLQRRFETGDWAPDWALAVLRGVLPLVAGRP